MSAPSRRRSGDAVAEPRRGSGTPLAAPYAAAPLMGMPLVAPLPSANAGNMLYVDV